MFSIDPVGCDDLDGALSIKVGVPCFMPYKGLKVNQSGRAVLEWGLRSWSPHI